MGSEQDKMSPLISSFEPCMEVLTNAIRQEKAIKVIQIGKNIKLSLHRWHDHL